MLGAGFIGETMPTEIIEVEFCRDLCVKLGPTPVRVIKTTLKALKSFMKCSRCLNMEISNYKLVDAAIYL